MGELSRLSWRVIDTIQKTIDSLDMTDAEVIAKSGVPRNTFYRKMRGETPFNTDDLDRIATALGVDPFTLLRGTPDNVTSIRPVGGSGEDLRAVARTTDPEPTDEQ